VIKVGNLQNNINDFRFEAYNLISKIELQSIRIKSETEHEGSIEILKLIGELRELI
jgi:hypothetical protein